MQLHIFADIVTAGVEGCLLIFRQVIFNDLFDTVCSDDSRDAHENAVLAVFTVQQCADGDDRLLVVEANWAELSRPYAFSEANPESIVNSLFALMLPPTNIHVFCARSRALVAWYIAKFCYMFIHRATHGSAGMWRAIFAPDSADLAPFPPPPKEGA